jgi:uncharacterized protein YabN with tetrapyrrole methylase and pyrophosphatase domain
MKEFDDLINIVKILRSPAGCPWDRAQKVEDYKRYLLEESYELIDAINNSKLSEIKEEIGDIILILVILAQMFSEKNKFSIVDSLQLINQKMVSRHPHVFSCKKLKTKEEVLKYWINAKAKTKKRKTVKDRLPLSASSLTLAEIFYKERVNLKNKQSSAMKMSGNQLLRSLGKVTSAKGKEKIMVKIILSLCALAHEQKIDLESALRKQVFALADRTKYSVGGEKS